jgi:three-Cys-motif partner protein
MTIKGNFFEQKREWSLLKDQILDEYLTPYLAKILHTKRPTRIVDCFAGKGRFDDGTDGSPLIIAKHIASELARNPTSDLRGIFIERKYAADLQANLVDFPPCEVLADDYEQCIQRFLTHAHNTQRNYFFYVDPYGIKCLDFHYFEQLKAVGFQSLEILVNLNTTGFLREGCRLLKFTRDLPEWTNDLNYEQDGKNSPAHMDDVAGGNYWRDILNEFQRGALDFHQAEERFAAEYTRRVRSILPLVVHVAIKERARQLPKYRLLFATNHRGGLFLMTDTMHKAWRILLERETGGQLSFFNDINWPVQPGQTIEEKVWAEVGDPLELGQLLTVLIERHGIAHSISEYKAVIRGNEGKMFAVCRTPDKTPTGKKAHHMDYDAARIVISRLAYPQDLLR